MESSVYVAGHLGMVGSALVRALKRQGRSRLITATRQEVNLTRQSEVEAFIQQTKPDAVLIAAAKVGGIYANNTFPADFIYENLMIASNLIHAAFQAGTKRVLFLGSSCIYPGLAPQPMPESCLLTGPLEHTNEAYAIAKIAGVKLCQHYRHQHGVTYHSAMPSNLYGPGDNYHGANSHVIPALLRRFHEAKVQQAPEVIVWGTGTPLREFLHVDDLADGCLHLLRLQEPPDWVNIGSGIEVSIHELAELVAATVGYQGVIRQDPTMPDGAPRKIMDVSIMKKLGWSAQTPLAQGLQEAYADFLSSMEHGSVRMQ